MTKKLVIETYGDLFETFRDELLEVRVGADSKAVLTMRAGGNTLRFPVKSPSCAAMIIERKLLMPDAESEEIPNAV